ncbi:hybrid sensor histidine kinase/response regulator [Nodosilinea sp. LEGE 07088]|uniref:hybrid sensor histidine kinase/response regulator n=1 Tax=Nodosilinea sp. LEGE 07088 TaxID=2777968 RepID=UPI0018803CFD|nr:hybrid sensor histidine kinase/response regulator [Nodosilinea sp. LEGE 07088]MBE9136395.1 hybrid sensor histidine kinase/response regulator [Nodosilinea sp. LEGE 07088]
MDAEQQVRLNFLEEVEDYFDQIEAVALELTTAELDASQLDRAMRAAHSVKGGAAMMGFIPLSQIAHRLEDFFKILRVRGDSVELTAQVESLFLQGVDALRLASNYSRKGVTIDAPLMQNKFQPIFDQLRSHLGDLRPEDEDQLLAQEENVDVATIIFSSGVEDCLDSFELHLEQLPVQQIAAELSSTAEQLAEFGRMSGLELFVDLCEEVKSHLPQIQRESIADFAQEVLSTWRRSHALVLIGRTSHLPQTVSVEASWLGENLHSSTQMTEGVQGLSHLDPDLDEADLLANVTSIFSELDVDAELDIDADSLALESLDWLASNNPQALQEFVGDLGDTGPEANLKADSESTAVDIVMALPLDRVLPEAEKAEATALIGAMIDRDEIRSLQDNSFQITPFQDEGLQALPDELTFSGEETALPELDTLSPATVSKPVLKTVSTTPKTMGSIQNTTVRVSAQQLQHLNTLFGKLIVERNAINLRLSQLHDLVALMQDRMGQLEQSNYQLRRWYDRASMEGLMSATVALDANAEKPALGQEDILASPFMTESRSQLQHQFDALEFDRYTDLHILSQEQMERIVQLQEVSTDIVLSLREANTATTDLHYTTRALQGGITKIQMRPFSTLVKRFPRVMRDLALQHHKQVHLKIEGEITLIDRVAIEALADPLNHLLRNAFDHGIEPPDERVAAGKPAEGTITIRAMHRGNQTLITIQDDGRGIDPAKIRHRLRRLGMSEGEVQQLGDRDLLDMIFEPGFSTTERVTELSGRGVGMDIVRTNLQQIRGDIRVDTQVGQGTTFVIQVPLAVSVLRVMLVESARMVFAVPLDSIEAISSLPSEAFQNCEQVAKTSEIVWKGQPVELISLADWLTFNTAGRAFEMDGTPTINQPTVLVINQDGSLKGLCIDRFWGEQEISLSPLKSPIALPPGFSGTSILGDGRVIPLIDPFQLLESLLNEKEAQTTELSAAPDLSRSVPITATPTGAERQLPTILIVDDSINVRRYLALTLEKAGYQVEQAKDGQEAIDKLLGGLETQAVICDIEMPCLDGYGVLSELRSRSEYEKLPIAMLTSRMNDKHRKLAMNLGASAYFSKPYNEQELLKTLQELMGVISKQPAMSHR